MTIPTYLSIVSDYFNATVAELSSWEDSIWSAKPKIFTLWLFREKAWQPIEESNKSV